ncbi:YheC/D like ATP-grasp [Alteribacillus persepolensis]|uniref:YheC/D like ATP-grasp n=1 Tax=Alteribacillus persepolensis TaxID=568899 RepID=A0A1G8HQQ1_9BACI|nr:YheC/YheD family protein [Alteribacillus persepolensis]SDI08872.1 YheC/D like ATP-grasp [Alteribacillus persepolensis]
MADTITPLKPLEKPRNVSIKEKTKEKKDQAYYGVLISHKYFQKLLKQKAHFRTKKLIKVNKETIKFRLYFFSVMTVNIKKQEIRGIYYDDKAGKFKTARYPYPDFLYRRGGVKKNKKTYHIFLRQCKRRNTIFLNPASLGNWDVYKRFQKVHSLKKYLQETILYKEPSDLYSMLKKHRIIYLKGKTGRKGQNVIRIEKVSAKKYRYRYYNVVTKKVETIQARSRKELIPFIESFYKGKTFMIQEAIPLLEINKRRVDLRAELQRDETGMITICGISARVGKAKSPVTTHAKAVTINELFTRLKLSSDKKAALLSDIEEFLYKIYQEAENHYGMFAEMGIDFALDQNDNIKFIECNSQSVKVSLYKAHGSQALEKSLSNVLQFADYLHKENTKKAAKAN